MIFTSDRKNGRIPSFGRKRWESRVAAQGRREVKGGTLLLGNDKNNVIANEVTFSV